MPAVDDFDAALADESRAGAPVPTLPDRLCRAAVASLPFDGAGLSATFLPHRRLPVGASSPEAAEAERLQFALGIGPCTAAHQSREPVHASHADLQARWPLYTAELARRTPYRSNLALPVGGPLSGVVIMDLYCTSPSLPDTTTMEAVAAVTSLVGEQLARDWADQAHESVLGLPPALRAPDATRRRAVWDAVAHFAELHDVESRTALALLRARSFVDHTDLEEAAASVLAPELD